MKKLKSLILLAIFCLSSVVSFAQVYAEFEVRNGYTYAVITNNGSSTVNVSWRCVNYQLGQVRDGMTTLPPDYETSIGPNVGWTWQYGEELLWWVNGYQQTNISFRGSSGGPGTPPNNNSDGYIYQGGVTVRYNGHTYPVYKKRGHSYIYDKKEGWIKID